MFRRARAVKADPSPDKLDHAPETAPHHGTEMRELARRTIARDLIELHTIVRGDDFGPANVRLVDISPYGCQARAVGVARQPGERLRVLLPLTGEVEGHVMWAIKGLFGCRFETPIDSHNYPRMLAAIRTGREDWVEAWPGDNGTAPGDAGLEVSPRPISLAGRVARAPHRRVAFNRLPTD